MRLVAILLMLWALFGCAVVVMMIFGVFQHVAMNAGDWHRISGKPGEFFLLAAASAWDGRASIMQGARAVLHALLVATLFVGSSLLCIADDSSHGWPVYGGAQGGGHYTTLSQINAANVAQLKQA